MALGPRPLRQAHFEISGDEYATSELAPMKRWMYVIPAAALAMSLALCAADALTSASPKEVQRSLDAFVATAPGAVVIVGLVNHGVTRIYTAGTPAAGAPPLNASTEFQIGSITKTFTATLLAEMVKSGKVPPRRSNRQISPSRYPCACVQRSADNLAQSLRAELRITRDARELRSVESGRPLR